MDLTQLLAARDKLNADIAKLQTLPSVDQSAIDQITFAVGTVDGAVVAIITPPAPKFDFSALDQNFASLTENVKTIEAPASPLGMTQAIVDGLAAALATANQAFLAAQGIR